MPARLEMWADLRCPYAHLAAHRLRQVLPEFPGAEVVHRSLAIEWVDEKPTPKEVLDAETPLIALEAPDLPYEPWHAEPSHWPSTMWPAFEAVKCAERQGWRLAHELDWRIRVAFWRDSRCVALRHVLLGLAREAGCDAKRFEEDFDSGAAKRQVLEEARRGWEALKLEASPTFVLPDGTRAENPAAPKVVLDEARHHRVVRVERPPGVDGWRAAYREMLARVAGGSS